MLAEYQAIFAAHPWLLLLILPHLWPLFTGLASFFDTWIHERWPLLGAFLDKSGLNAKGTLRVLWLKFFGVQPPEDK